MSEVLISRELRDLLALHLSGAAPAGSLMITVPTDGAVVPNKCILVISNGTTFADLSGAETVAISENNSGVLTIEESVYAGVHKKITDVDWDGLQASWPSGANVSLFFNQMYYESITDAVNGLITEEHTIDKPWNFEQGIIISGEPATSQDGSFRFKNSKLQARENGAWRDLLTSGLPGSPYPYGTLFFSPQSSWTPSDQLRMRHLPTVASAPVMDADGEISVRRQISIWDPTLGNTNKTIIKNNSGHLEVSGHLDVSIANDLYVSNSISTGLVSTPTLAATEIKPLVSSLNLKLYDDNTEISFFKTAPDGAAGQFVKFYQGDDDNVAVQYYQATGFTDLSGIRIKNNELFDGADLLEQMSEPFYTRSNPTSGNGLLAISLTTSALNKGYITEVGVSGGGDVQLVANGNFAAEGDDWTVEYGSVDFSGNSAVVTADHDAGSGSLYFGVFSQEIYFPKAGSYLMTFDYTPGPHVVDLVILEGASGSTFWSPLYPFYVHPSEPGLHKVGFMYRSGTSGDTATFDNISIFNLDENIGDIEMSASVLDLFGLSTKVRGVYDLKLQIVVNDDVLTLVTGSSSTDYHLHFNQPTQADSTLKVINHIIVGEDIGDPEPGAIRYTAANAFEGYYEVSPGVYEWKSFRTEEANLPASSPGYMLRYEDGHWKGTGTVQAHDRANGFIHLDNDVLAGGAIRLANLDDSHDPIEGMVRYNGDFQGYMRIRNSSGIYANYWVSLTGGGLTSGANQGEMLVYNADIEKWVSAGDEVLWVDDQMTIKGRLSAKDGLTIPKNHVLPGDNSLVGDDQAFMVPNPVEWEEGTVTGPAPDGNWIRVLPPTGDRKIDKVQVWAQIGEQTYTHLDESDEEESQTIPVYGWLDLVATTESGDSLTLPNPSGHNGQMLIVDAGLYTFTSRFVFNEAINDSPTLFLPSSHLKLDGAIETGADQYVKTYRVEASSKFLLSSEDGPEEDEPEKFLAIGHYDSDRLGHDNHHPEDFTWQVIRKVPTDDSIEYGYPGETYENDEPVPLEGYGKDPWDQKDLVIQYHASARIDSLRKLVDSFESLPVTINNIAYTADADGNAYLPTFMITLNSPLEDELADNTLISIFAGVFAKTVGVTLSGALEIEAEINGQATLLAFTNKPCKIGNVTYTGSAPGGASCTLTLAAPLESPILVGTYIRYGTIPFARVTVAQSIGQSTLVIEPLTGGTLPDHYDAFTNIVIDIETKTVASFGHRFSELIDVTLTPAIEVPLAAGDVIATEDGPMGLVNQAYTPIPEATETVIEMARYYKKVEAVRYNRAGNAYFGAQIHLRDLMISTAPIVVGQFVQGVMTPEPGMIRFEGDMETWIGDKWVSMTNRLAPPQMPIPVLNFPTIGWYGAPETALDIIAVGIGTEITVADILELEEGTLITFSNGVAANVVSIDGVDVTLSANVLPMITINGTDYHVSNVVDDTVLTIDANISVPAGTRVVFANGAEAVITTAVVADNELILNKTVSVFPSQINRVGVIETIGCIRFNDNTLALLNSTGLAQGDVLEFNDGNTVVVVGDYNAFDLENPTDYWDYRLHRVHYTEIIGTTLRYDSLQGWHFTDSTLVNNDQSYFKEGIVVGPVISAPAVAGMIRWNGDFEGYNGGAWVSLTGNGDQDIAPSDEGNMLVMGETIWQPTAQMRFFNHGGAGSAGVLHVNNVIKLGEFTDDEMPSDEWVRGMVRHRGDLEYYTGHNWISLTDYYGLPGGHLPLPGVDPFVAGSTVRYVAPGEGAPNGLWVETSVLVISDTGVSIDGDIVTDTVKLNEIGTGLVSDTPDDEGRIKYFMNDFYGRTSTGWRSLTSKLPIVNGAMYDTLYMHYYTDDEDREGTPGNINREWLPTSAFQIQVVFDVGDDPPAQQPLSVKAVFDCDVQLKELIDIKHVITDPGEETYYWRITSTDEVGALPNRFIIGLMGDDRVLIANNYFVLEQGLDILTLTTGHGNFAGDLNAASITVTNDIAGAGLSLSDLALLQAVQMSGKWYSNYSQNAGGFAAIEVGVDTGIGVNHTVDAFICHGLATFDFTIVIGDQKSEAPVPGMIRYHSDDFQGWDGTNWLSLTGDKSVNVPGQEGAFLWFTDGEWIKSTNVSNYGLTMTGAIDDIASDLNFVGNSVVFQGSGVTSPTVVSINATGVDFDGMTDIAGLEVTNIVAAEVDNARGIYVHDLGTEAGYGYLYGIEVSAIETGGVASAVRVGDIKATYCVGLEVVSLNSTPGDAGASYGVSVRVVGNNDHSFATGVQIYGITSEHSTGISINAVESVTGDATGISVQNVIASVNNDAIGLYVTDLNVSGTGVKYSIKADEGKFYNVQDAQIDGDTQINGVLSSTKYRAVGTKHDVEIISGLIDPDYEIMRIDTEASAVSDDLSNITNGEPGQIIRLFCEDAARVITIKHNSRIKMKSGADFTYTTIYECKSFMWADWLSVWAEI